MECVFSNTAGNVELVLTTKEQTVLLKKEGYQYNETVENHMVGATSQQRLCPRQTSRSHN